MLLIVIHAIWDNYTNNKLQLWAESSSPTGSAARRVRKQAEKQQSQQHPFSLQREPLREAISELAGNLLAKSAGSGSVIPSCVLMDKLEWQETHMNAK